jgi:5-methyltetrahydrofolate--homocysteine methyltransferase
MSAFDLTPLSEALIRGDVDATLAEVRAGLAVGVPPLEIITAGCQPSMDEVGRLFYLGEVFLPDLILAGRAMTAALELLLPALQSADAAALQGGRVVLGTVEGDLHDIGKNLVGTLISVAGFRVTDLGTNVPVKKLIATAVESGACIIGTSSLLTTSNYYQRELIERATRMGVRDRFYFIVGGGSVTPEFARQIGADGWARSAVGAAELCKQLVQGGAPPPLPAPLLVDR